VPCACTYAGGIEEGSITLDPCRQYVDKWVTVSEAEIADAGK
jgi:threonine dehydratase